MSLELSILKLKLTTGIEMQIYSDNALTRLVIPEDCSITKLVLPAEIKDFCLVEETDMRGIKEIIFPSELRNVPLFRMKGDYIEKFVFGDVGCFHRSVISNLSYRDTLKQVIIKSVNKISNHFFDNFSLLTDFDFSCINTNGVVGVYAFQNCVSLKELKNIDKCREVEFSQRCFLGCSGLTHIELDGKCKFGDCCFEDCENLDSVVIGDVILGSYCFLDCTGIRHVLIKDLTGLCESYFKCLFEGCNSNIEFNIYGVSDDININHILGKDIHHNYFSNIKTHKEKYME